LKRRAISRKALDNSRKAYEQAQTQSKFDEATVARLEAALQAAEINLGYTDIVSPLDGTVVSRNVEVGQTVVAGIEPPLFLVAADLSVMQVNANVSKNDIGGVKLGDKASFTVESLPNHPFTGEVTQIGLSPKTYEHVTTDDVVISAPNPDLLLEPGMTATIRIVINRRDDILRAPHPD
jgi:HlyD family secretion protein